MGFCFEGVFGFPLNREGLGSGTGLKFAGRLDRSSLFMLSVRICLLVRDFRGKGLGFLRMYGLLDLLRFLLMVVVGCSTPPPGMSSGLAMNMLA